MPDSTPTWRTLWAMEWASFVMELSGSPTAADLDDIEQVFAIHMRALRRQFPPQASAVPGDGLAKASTPDEPPDEGKEGVQFTGEKHG